MAYVFDQLAKSWINPAEPVRFPEPAQTAMRTQEPQTQEMTAAASTSEFPGLNNLTLDRMVQGVILSEILGPPVCRRRGRGRR